MYWKWNMEWRISNMQ